MNAPKVGIIRLLNNSVYEAAYPLHDGLHIQEKNEKEDKDPCSRNVSTFSDKRYSEPLNNKR